jgi:hypothetical protein
VKIPTKDLTGAALDWAVAQCEGLMVQDKPVVGKIQLVRMMDMYERKGADFCPSTDWAQGGPISERERLQTSPTEKGRASSPWRAFVYDRIFEEDGTEHYMGGPTPLIAAMRCYVASKLGDEVEIPEELA